MVIKHILNHINNNTGKSINDIFNLSNTMLTVKKKDLIIDFSDKPRVLIIAISFVLFFIKIVKPEIILNAATTIIRVSIINITFLSTLRALKKDLFVSDHVEIKIF